MTVSGRQGMGLAGAVFPVQLPTIYSVNDLGFAAMKAGFAIERLHPLRALSGQRPVLWLLHKSSRWYQAEASNIRDGSMLSKKGLRSRANSDSCLRGGRRVGDDGAAGSRSAAAVL